MDNRIDRPGAGLRPAGIRTVDQPLDEGRGGALRRGDSAIGGGRRGETSWRINLAGPFDPHAPRGTYLDIVV